MLNSTSKYRYPSLKLKKQETTKLNLAVVSPTFQSKAQRLLTPTSKFKDVFDQTSLLPTQTSPNQKSALLRIVTKCPYHVHAVEIFNEQPYQKELSQLLSARISPRQRNRYLISAQDEAPGPLEVQQKESALEIIEQHRKATIHEEEIMRQKVQNLQQYVKNRDYVMEQWVKVNGSLPVNHNEEIEAAHEFEITKRTRYNKLRW